MTGWTDIVVIGNEGRCFREGLSAMGPFGAGIGTAYLLGQRKCESGGLRAAGCGLE